MKKIVLIEPKTRKGHVFSASSMPRLGLPLLGTQLKNAGYEVQIYVESITDLPWPKIVDADLIGISTTTSTSQEAYRLASFIRSQYSMPIVIGGIHATFLPDEALQYGDYVVRGEADLNFLPLVRSLMEDGGPPIDIDIPGISYLKDGKPVHNPLSTEAIDVDALPIPDFGLYSRKMALSTIPVMTSRGCPYNCSFCSVAMMFGRQYRYRKTEIILEELANYQGKNIFFCDDNFAASSSRSKELLRGMLERKIKLKRWGAQVRVEAAKDDELLDLMRRTGAKTVYIGLESINPATLEAYNKKQSLEDIREAIRRFHDYGIKVHGMFVFGSDEDTVQTIRDTADFALEMRIDSVQFLVLTPLPGTPLFHKLEAEGRLLTKQWELYDGHHAVYKPALMSAVELQDETVKAMKKFYSLPGIFQNIFLTGVSSLFYRSVGWLLIRRFEKQSRRYDQILSYLQETSAKTVRLLYKRIHPKKLEVPVALEAAAKTTAENDLKVYISEKNGVLYLTLRGFLSRLTLKELKRSVKGLLPEGCFHLVVNVEGLSLLSDKSAKSFRRFLDRMGKRVRRLQLIYKAEEQKTSFLINKLGLKLPRFELLPGKR